MVKVEVWTGGRRGRGEGVCRDKVSLFQQAGRVFLNGNLGRDHLEGHVPCASE